MSYVFKCLENNNVCIQQQPASEFRINTERKEVNCKQEPDDCATYWKNEEAKGLLSNCVGKAARGKEKKILNCFHLWTGVKVYKVACRSGYYIVLPSACEPWDPVAIATRLRLSCVCTVFWSKNEGDWLWPRKIKSFVKILLSKLCLFCILLWFNIMPKGPRTGYWSTYYQRLCEEQEKFISRFCSTVYSVAFHKTLFISRANQARIKTKEGIWNIYMYRVSQEERT
jgi:hypothetical protein